MTEKQKYFVAIFLFLILIFKCISFCLVCCSNDMVDYTDGRTAHLTTTVFYILMLSFMFYLGYIRKWHKRINIALLSGLLIILINCFLFQLLDMDEVFSSMFLFIFGSHNLLLIKLDIKSFGGFMLFMSLVYLLFSATNIIGYSLSKAKLKREQKQRECSK